MSDPIERQAAIDALKAMAVPRYLDPACEDIWERDRTIDRAIDVMRGLPAAERKKREVERIERNEQMSIEEAVDIIRNEAECVRRADTCGRGIAQDAILSGKTRTS